MHLSIDHLLYGIEIYGNAHRSYLNKLMVLNNKLLQILQNASRNTPVADLYKNVNTHTIPDLHIFRILILIHKFFHHKDKLPVILTSYFNGKIFFIIMTHVIGIIYILFGVKLPTAQVLLNVKVVISGTNFLMI